MKAPFVSIILPVHNEANHIRRSLGAVLQQDYSVENMEVLVADGLSTDNTRAIIEELAGQYPKIELKILDNSEQIVPTGLNKALQIARGEIVVRVDGHTMIAPDYIRQCVDTLQRTQADNVGGRMAAVGNTSFGEAVALGTSTPFGIGGGRFHFSDKNEWVDTVYMGAWPRRVFQEVGLFDEELIRDQDDEFNYRLREYGGRILLSSSIRSEYTVRSTPGSLWRQYYQYGFWKVRVLQKHPRQMRPRQFVPPLFVFALLVNLALIFITSWSIGLLFIVVGLYLFANFTASILASRKNNWRYLGVLPLVFLILHLGYGLGFLIGLIRFAGRWKDKVGKTPTFMT
ncbi:MAG: glycosyltransferase family 2 protein [Anaerolineales bacterium]|nr:glycosyltransferase family 2 protein [Anaerolineales bacterium]